MGYAIIAWDGDDAGAVDRRMAVRDRHVENLHGWAADGRLAFGAPLYTPDWKPAGSLMLLQVPDRAGLDAYLASEPFAAGDVWNARRDPSLPHRAPALPAAAAARRADADRSAPTPSSSRATALMKGQRRGGARCARRT